jgi:hypothetical protein
MVIKSYEMEENRGAGNQGRSSIKHVEGGEAGRNSSSSFTQYIMDERFSVHGITLLAIGM